MTVGICGHGMLARSCEICEMIATLADRDSAIERLKAAATTWKERCEASWEHEDGLSRLLQEQIDIKLEVGERMEKAEQAIAARDAEIERLKARISTLEGAMRADEDRLVEAAKLGGVGYFGCDTPEVMADTIGELREQLRLSTALVEKRERQLVWACSWHEHRNGSRRVVRFPGVEKYYDGTKSGLLAAIDEATGGSQ